MQDEEHSLTPSPSSISGHISVSSDPTLPLTLAEEELQLALNKEATEDELLKAIARTKELVLQSDQCSTERKWLVRHLIELRLRLQECREALKDPGHPRNKSSGVSRRVICGHHLTLQPLLRTTSLNYCDHCTGIIWNVVQAWYKCEDCSYRCHHKCLSSIIRECAHVTASEKGCYELEICPEVGLSAQKYCCAECKVPLPVAAPKGFLCIVRLILTGYEGEARRCDYNGLYYCSACHWGSLAVIPARVIHNWDMTPKPVCQASLQQLKVTANRPLINLEKLNPRLFTMVHELNLMKRLRQQLNGMRKYLLVCRNASEDHILWKTVDTPHLIESTDMYSMHDLMNTYNGELLTKLHVLCETFKKHISIDCEVCKGRGHICEVCSNDEVVFPYEADRTTCKECGAVYHKDCFDRKRFCCRCVRLQRRLETSREVEL